MDERQNIRAVRTRLEEIRDDVDSAEAPPMRVAVGNLMGTLMADHRRVVEQALYVPRVRVPDLPSSLREAREARVAREEAMVRDLALMRQRAEEAEERERDARRRAEQREGFMLKLTIASVIVGALGSAAAIAAVVLPA